MRSVSLICSKPGDCKIAFQMLEIVLQKPGNPLLQYQFSEDVRQYLPTSSSSGYQKAWCVLVKLISIQKEVTLSTSRIKEIVDYFTENGMKIDRSRIEYVLRNLYLDAIAIIFNSIWEERILKEVLAK